MLKVLSTKMKKAWMIKMMEEMKKCIIVFFLALTALVSCDKKSADIISSPSKSSKTLDLTVNTIDTKAIKTAWVDGDNLYLYFREDAGAPKSVVVTYQDGKWMITNEASQANLDAVTAASGTVYAQYVAGSEKSVATVEGNILLQEEGLINFAEVQHGEAGFSMLGDVVAANIELSQTGSQICIKGISGDWTLETPSESDYIHLSGISAVGMPLEYSASESGYFEYSSNSIQSSILDGDVVFYIGKIGNEFADLKLSITNKITGKRYCKSLGAKRLVMNKAYKLNGPVLAENGDIISDNGWAEVVNAKSIVLDVLPNSLPVTSMAYFKSGDKDIKLFGASVLSAESYPSYQVLNFETSPTMVGFQAFVSNKSITKAVFPDTVTEFGQNCFNGCTNLSSINIPSGLITIATYAFNDCNLPIDIVLPNTVTSIGSYAFSKSHIRSINIPSGVLAIDNYTFYSCKQLSTVSLSEGLKKLGNNAFDDCGELTSITLPSTLTSLGQSAFRNCCKLSGTITIPSGVTSIPGDTFYGCKMINEVILNDNISSIGNSAFLNCWEMDIPAMPENLETIGTYAFYCCYKLKEVILPDGFLSMGTSAFRDCRALTEVSIPGTCESIPSHAFQVEGGEASAITSLKVLNLGEGIKTIGADAFYRQYQLKTVIIPEGVTSIDSYAFFACSGLVSLTLPSTLNQLGSSAFDHCKSMKTIEVKALEPPIWGDKFAINLGFPGNAGAAVIVPESSIDAYKTSSYWGSLSAHIVSDAI